MLCISEMRQKDQGLSLRLRRSLPVGRWPFLSASPQRNAKGRLPLRKAINHHVVRKYSPADATARVWIVKLKGSFFYQIGSAVLEARVGGSSQSHRAEARRWRSRNCPGASCQIPPQDQPSSSYYYPAGPRAVPLGAHAFVRLATFCCRRKGWANLTRGRHLSRQIKHWHDTRRNNLQFSPPKPFFFPPNGRGFCATFSVSWQDGD
jgi:hypothetical protein